MELRQINKFLMQNGEMFQTLETTATETEFKELWEGFLDDLNNGKIAPDLKESLLNNKNLDENYINMTNKAIIDLFIGYVNEKGHLLYYH